MCIRDRINGECMIPTISEDASNTYLYFTYNHSTKTIEIIGTTAIPEFLSWTILPLLLVATVLIILCKKWLPKKPKQPTEISHIRRLITEDC